MWRTRRVCTVGLNFINCHGRQLQHLLGLADPSFAVGAQFLWLSLPVERVEAVPAVERRLVPQHTALAPKAILCFEHGRLKGLSATQSAGLHLLQTHMCQDCLARLLCDSLVKCMTPNANLQQLGLLLWKAARGPLQAHEERALLADDQPGLRPRAVLNGHWRDCEEGNAGRRGIVHGDVACANLCVEEGQVVDEAAGPILHWLAVDGMLQWDHAVVLIRRASRTTVHHHTVVLVGVVLVLLGEHGAFQKDAGRVQEAAKAAFGDRNQFRHQHWWGPQRCEQRWAVDRITPAKRVRSVQLQALPIWLRQALHRAARAHGDAVHTLGLQPTHQQVKAIDSGRPIVALGAHRPDFLMPELPQKPLLRLICEQALKVELWHILPLLSIVGDQPAT
mmetsp:Transcript_47964/g.114288  ORF Transcript_47964/g.114288 Transcript_47964/m.114288 type:complete len:392 (-) Transcript_47964:5331-6506(-)